MKRVFLTLLMLTVFSNTNAESLLTGEKEIVLFSTDNKSLVIGKILFITQDEKTQYKIDLDSNIFSNEFLSMRPFQCIHQENKMVCHLQYPYELQGYITESDLTDLEYDLLFLHKSASQYGIDAWNGLYYQLNISEKKFTGVLHEVDLNVLVAPPEEGVLRPITDEMLHTADPSHHLYPRLEVR